MTITTTLDTYIPILIEVTFVMAVIGAIVKVTGKL